MNDTSPIRPALALPTKLDLSDQDTGSMPDISQQTTNIFSVIPRIPDPVTPIPPALIRPFLSGTLPLPPGVNRSYKPGSGRHPIVGTPALRQFKADAALLLSQSYHDWPQIEALRTSRRKTPLRMDIIFYFESLWRSDIDGKVKAVMDAVFCHLELNDVLVVEMPVFKKADPRNPRVEFEVCCLAR